MGVTLLSLWFKDSDLGAPKALFVSLGETSSLHASRVPGGRVSQAERSSTPRLCARGVAGRGAGHGRVSLSPEESHLPRRPLHRTGWAAGLWKGDPDSQTHHAQLRLPWVEPGTGQGLLGTWTGCLVGLQAYSGCPWCCSSRTFLAEGRAGAQTSEEPSAVATASWEMKKQDFKVVNRKQRW